MSLSGRPIHVLFLCTGNSARSILAEALINRLGGDQFQGFSAGSNPKGQVHPMALALLQQERLPTAGLRSKSWDEFAGPNAPSFDFVITVCDNAAGEVCPIWPGHPMTVHWGIPDPAAVQGSEAERQAAFLAALKALDGRIHAFVDIPFNSIDRTELKQRLKAIAQIPGADES